MLKVVQPPTGGQGEGAPARRRKSPALRLTDAERMRLRAALRHLRAVYGSWALLAEAMGVRQHSLEQFVSSGNGGSHALALCAAKAAGHSTTPCAMSACMSGNRSTSSSDMSKPSQSA